MKQKSRILVTGASGFLGWSLCGAAAETFDVFGTCFRHTVSSETATMIAIDLTNISELSSLLDRVAPHILIHTAAISQPNYCQQHPAESELINVTVPARLARLCAEKNIKLVFTSSDLVFDGTNPPYTETDEVNPLSLYGEQKARAEETILEANSSASVCRMPLMYGSPSPSSGSFMQPLIAKLRAGEVLNLFTDEFRTPVSATDASHGLLLAAQKHAGILHLGGPERLSRYDIGMRVAKSLDIDSGSIRPIRQQDFLMPAPRPHDVSLDSTLANNLGWKPKRMLLPICE
ncbi:MAG: SDR family oxidoreductase [Fibrobacterota bacterium]